MLESQGDWKRALRVGKEPATKHVGLEVSALRWNSFNSIRRIPSIPHPALYYLRHGLLQQNLCYLAKSARVRGSFPYEVSLLCEASFLPFFVSPILRYSVSPIHLYNPHRGFDSITNCNGGLSQVTLFYVSDEKEISSAAREFFLN